MAWRESACVQVRASAIWPTAAEAWLSSSRSGPFGNLSTARPSAIAPEDTTSTSRLPPCSHAMSSVREASQSSFTREAEASTISEEPTFTTMRRKSVRLGMLAAIGLGIERMRTLYHIGASAADLKFLNHLQQTLLGTSNRKAALESKSCKCPFVSEVRVRVC